MKCKFYSEEREYDGSQLRPLFAYETFGLEGESTVAWVGPCLVKNEHMKDGEDLFAGDSIAGSKMLHFIVEVFEQPMFAMVSLQRLLSASAMECLSGLSNKTLLRDGDDIFLNQAKMSISIASRGPVSSMIHFALNVSNEGTPVKTSSLEDLGIKAEVFVAAFLPLWEKEVLGIFRASKKVFPLS